MVVAVAGAGDEDPVVISDQYNGICDVGAGVKYASYFFNQRQAGLF